MINQAAAEAKGLSPIQPWLTEIRGIKDKSGYAAIAAKADRLGVGTMFFSFVGQDDKAPETYIYQMGQGGIGMPDRDFYLVDNPRFVALRASYLKHLENVLVLAGEPNAPARAQALFDFEKAVAGVHWNKVDSSDSTKTYNKRLWWFQSAQLAAALPMKR